jgi:Zn-dependent M28 family amino/carboxypeptidase
VLAIAHDTRADSVFDETRAFSHLRSLVELGPRPSGSPAIVLAQEYIMNELARQGLEVREQEFIAHTPSGPKKMKNIIGVVPGASEEILIIGTHYETKLIEGLRFVGANDGASGTAVLLELARCLKDKSNPLTIWLVFFDGEEAFVRWTRDDSLYGSRHMAKFLKDSGQIKNVKAVLILDMIGDAHLRIESEMHSTGWLREIVWAHAKKLGHAEMFTDRPNRIQDDHLPFLEQDIPALDIIDLRYGPESRTNEYWHTEQDDLEHVSPRSLKIVGDVVLESLPEIAARVISK